MLAGIIASIKKFVGIGVCGAWDISTAEYDNKTYNPAQAATKTGIFFKPDGLSMYVVGAGEETAFQYTLSTAWDVTTATYANKSASLAAPGTFAVGLYIGDSGTKMYVIASPAGPMYQYTLSTPWDLSTSSVTANTLAISTLGAAPRGLHLSQDGLNVYVVDESADDIGQWTLGTAWDISTAGTVTATDISAQLSFPTSMWITPDGTKLHIGGLSTDTIFQYTLGTPHNASTLSYDNISLLVSSEATSPSGLFFDDNGTRMYIIDQSTGVYQYSLGYTSDTALAQASYDGKSADVADANSSRGLFIGDAGNKMYIVSNTQSRIYEWDLGTAYDVSTAEGTPTSILISANAPSPLGAVFSSDGTKMYVLSYTNNGVYQYTLSTPWVVTSATYASKSMSVSAETLIQRCIRFSTDGTKMYHLGANTRDVFQYNLGTAWDISTGSYANKTISVIGEGADTQGIAFNIDGTSMFTADAGTDNVFQYNLGTAWDIATAVYTGITFNILAQTTSVTELHFDLDGTKMYVLDEGNDVYQYSIPTCPPT